MRIIGSKAIAAACVAAGLGLAASAASATPITRVFDFTASGFTSDFGPPMAAPTDPVVGSFEITFDPAAGDVFDVTTGISLRSLNIPLGSPLAYTYFSGPDVLRVGGLSFGVSGVLFASNDFRLQIADLTGTPTFQGLTYAELSVGTTGFDSSTGQVTFGATPEPAAWALLLTGFGLVGLSLRGRRLGRAR